MEKSLQEAPLIPMEYHVYGDLTMLNHQPGPRPMNHSLKILTIEEGVEEASWGEFISMFMHSTNNRFSIHPKVPPLGGIY